MQSNTQARIYKKIDDLCDYMIDDNLQSLDISETSLKSSPTLTQKMQITKSIKNDLCLLTNVNL